MIKNKWGEEQFGEKEKRTNQFPIGQSQSFPDQQPIDIQIWL